MERTGRIAGALALIGGLVAFDLLNLRGVPKWHTVAIAFIAAAAVYNTVFAFRSLLSTFMAAVGLGVCAGAFMTIDVLGSYSYVLIGTGIGMWYLAIRETHRGTFAS